MRYSSTLHMWLCLLLVASCAVSVRHKVRLAPRYQGVDSKLAPYADSWLLLAKNRGLTFHHKVNIGFDNIEETSVIGLSHINLVFREIDIDKTWWSHASPTSREALVWHELTHSYCGRDHDYDLGKKYGDMKFNKKLALKGEGFYPDGCPKSLMFPEIVDDYCTKLYYNEYKVEMFNRCFEY